MTTHHTEELSYYMQRKAQAAANYQLPHSLDAMIKQLRLPALRAAAQDALAGMTPKRQQDFEDFLHTICSAEITSRAQSALKANRTKAGLPTGVTLANFNPARSTIPTKLREDLITLRWLNTHNNLVLCGPHGTGKSMFVEALAAEAITIGKKVKWVTMEYLGYLVTKHQIDYTTTKTFNKFTKYDLIVIDDIGLLDIDHQQAEGFLRLINTTYNSTSVAITSNYHPASFDEITPIKHAQVLAAIDRLLHHAYVIQTQGESQRFIDATTHNQPEE